MVAGLPESPWETKIDDLYKFLNSSENGLSQIEALKRLKLNGANTFEKTKRKSAPRLLLSQFENWLMVVLIGAAGVSYLLGQRLDAVVVLGIVFFSVILGFFQEYKAEKTIDKLKKYITNKAKVLRDGKWLEIESKYLVIGDIVTLRIGDKVPADLRLIEVDDFSTNEAIITGESQEVYKTLDQTHKVTPAVYEQKNMVFAGSFVSSGVATGVVIATGNTTFLGKTAHGLSQVSNLTDFQIQIKNFSAFLFKVIVALCIFVFVANFSLGKGMFESFLFSVALAVGIAPELLPMIITVTLSQGATMLAKRKVVVKKLISVEDLGNIDTLCTDKTGTLTEGEFSLERFENVDGVNDDVILVKAMVCSTGFAHAGRLTSNQLDKAIWAHSLVKQLKRRLNKYLLVDENEFDFDRRMMSVVVSIKKELKLFAKGSPESIIPLCTEVKSQNAVHNLTGSVKLRLSEKLKQFETDGFRVIALAEKVVDKEETEIRDEKRLCFLGWLLFEDPVKDDAKDALTLFEKLGVEIKIISGDSVQPVLNVAQKVGIADETTKVITGKYLNRLSAHEFLDTVYENKLFARITPEQKNNIVACLNRDGHVVGFLGDGVNDALALKAADVGIAVDGGAEVAKEAADILLLKKDLMVLAGGIEQGRKTFGNITKYILNTISANYGNMVTVALSSLFLPFMPLLPKQILLNNFISDIPLLAIATDNVDTDFVKKPKKWNMIMIRKFMFYFGFMSSFFDFLMILPLIVVWRVGPEVFRTAWFIESSISEILITFALRTHLPFYRSRPSKWLINLSILAILSVMVLPFNSLGEYLFAFVHIQSYIWIWIFVVVGSYFLTMELVKVFFFKKFSG